VHARRTAHGWCSRPTSTRPGLRSCATNLAVAIIFTEVIVDFCALLFSVVPSDLSVFFSTLALNAPTEGSLPNMGTFHGILLVLRLSGLVRIASSPGRFSSPFPYRIVLRHPPRFVYPVSNRFRSSQPWRPNHGPVLSPAPLPRTCAERRPWFRLELAGGRRFFQRPTVGLDNDPFSASRSYSRSDGGLFLRSTAPAYDAPSRLPQGGVVRFGMAI